MVIDAPPVEDGGVNAIVADALPEVATSPEGAAAVVDAIATEQLLVAVALPIEFVKVTVTLKLFPTSES